MGTLLVYRRKGGIMIALDRNIYRQAKSGEMSLKALADYLLRAYPAAEIAQSLAEIIIEYQEPKPIAITRAEFESHFRIQGVRADGTEETRGRRKDTSL